MSTGPRPHVRDALAIHLRMLALDGGAPGVRDPGLLVSALARPRHHHAYEGTTTSCGWPHATPRQSS